jgi:hypothetical protein
VGRWTRPLIVSLLVAGSGYFLGRAPIRADRAPATSVALGHPVALPVTALMSARDRSHPQGLDQDDSPRWSPRWGPMWKGGGRHPVWRGCLRVYNPAMNAFLNAPGPVPTASGA